MSEVFLKVLNMSITASVLIIAVLLLRPLLSKAPKWIDFILWGMVGLRLVLPFSIQSNFSIIPSAEPISPDIMMSAHPQIDMGIDSVNQSINPVIAEHFTPNPAASANPLQTIVPILAAVWIAGMICLLIYAAVSYINLYNKVKTAIPLRDNIYQSENVNSPFILGMIKPRVYLPFVIADEDVRNVLAHEKTHIRHHDPLWKPIGFLILAVHWFNPLVWIAYIMFNRDIEYACDEQVVKNMNMQQRSDYSQSLLNCSMPKRMINTCPLAFGEIGVKGRVKTVLNYKKPAFWIIIVAIVVCIAVAIFFMTVPSSPSTDVSSDDVMSIVIFDGNTGKSVNITNEEQIHHIIDNLNSVKLKRGKRSTGYTGYSFKTTIYVKSDDPNEGYTYNGFNNFIINSPDTIRKDPFFYKVVEGSIDYDFIEEIINDDSASAFTPNGNDDPNTEDESSLSKPPVLNVAMLYGSDSIKVDSANYAWYKELPDGTRQVTIADGMHPLDAGDNLSVLYTTMPDAVITTDQERQYQGMNISSFALNFGTINPKSVSVRRWPQGTSTVEDIEKSEDLSVEQGDGFWLVNPSDDGAYVYEVSAEWDDDNSAWYAFRTVQGIRGE